jgi:hypothetical protein
MRIKKSPYSQLRKLEKGYNFSLKSKKDFQIWTFRTRKKRQHRREELKPHHCEKFCSSRESHVHMQEGKREIYETEIGREKLNLCKKSAHQEVIMCG